jgi:hypothetical protein
VDVDGMVREREYFVGLVLTKDERNEIESSGFLYCFGSLQRVILLKISVNISHCHDKYHKVPV